tara:strand:+ start:2147 stop:2584 length:438 start_codon:yes stop_codon:yes gene_type:complete
MATNFIQEDQYVGKQILIDSDRLVFNGRDDSVFSAKNLFLLKTDGEFHVNSKNDVFINGSKIYIGPIENGQDVNIPAVRSRELKQILTELINSLDMFFKVQYPMTSGLMGPNPGINNGLNKVILKDLAKIKSRLDDIDSKKVFIK